MSKTNDKSTYKTVIIDNEVIIIDESGRNLIQAHKKATLGLWKEKKIRNLFMYAASASWLLWFEWLLHPLFENQGYFLGLAFILSIFTGIAQSCVDTTTNDLELLNNHINLAHVDLEEELFETKKRLIEQQQILSLGKTNKLTSFFSKENENSKEIEFGK